MKNLYLLLLLPLASFGQDDACTIKSLLYSRELFPGPVTVARAMTLSDLNTSCVNTSAIFKTQEIALPEVKPLPYQNYQYYPLDPIHQRMFGNDPFPATTEQMVNHLVFDRN